MLGRAALSLGVALAVTGGPATALADGGLLGQPSSLVAGAKQVVSDTTAAVTATAQQATTQPQAGGDSSSQASEPATSDSASTVTDPATEQVAAPIVTTLVTTARPVVQEVAQPVQTILGTTRPVVEKVADTVAPVARTVERTVGSVEQTVTQVTERVSTTATRVSQTVAPSARKAAAARPIEVTRPRVAAQPSTSTRGRPGVVLPAPSARVPVQAAAAPRLVEVATPATRDDAPAPQVLAFHPPHAVDPSAFAPLGAHPLQLAPERVYEAAAAARGALAPATGREAASVPAPIRAPGHPDSPGAAPLGAAVGLGLATAILFLFLVIRGPGRSLRPGVSRPWTPPYLPRDERPG